MKFLIFFLGNYPPKFEALVTMGRTVYGKLQVDSSLFTLNFMILGKVSSLIF